MASQDPSHNDSPLSILNFSNMAIQPPITTNSIHNFSPSQIASDALSTRIIIHPRFPTLVQAFLMHKLAQGSPQERSLYTKTITTWQAQIRRLVAKRPLVFMGSSDFTILRDGRTLSEDSTGQWDRNGTLQQQRTSNPENSDLTIEEYLTYDEIMLSSLLGVSGFSYCINDGARNNCGRHGEKGTFEERGVIVGVVGARFEREGRMDSVFVLSHPSKGDEYTMHPELQDHFFEFFGTRRSSYATSSGFDGGVYQARIRVTADLLLLEASARAAEAAGESGRTYAHVYVVGLGLGVWQYHPSQAELYIIAFAEAISQLPPTHRIRTVEFAYIDRVPSSAKGHVGQCAKKQGLNVRFTRRNPAGKMEGEGPGKEDLLVLSYAWDGNAFPGNEYWAGSLRASGDPAAACMSTIGELHNPMVNEGFLERIHVVGE